MRLFLILLLLGTIANAGLIHDIDFPNKIDRATGDNLTFTRATTAYNDDGSTASSGTMRTLSSLYASPTVTGSISGYTVIAANLDYIYSHRTGGLIYRSVDGSSWVQIGDLGANAFRGMLTDKGTLILSRVKTGDETSGTLWRYDGSWTKVITDGVFTTASLGASPAQWSFSQAGDYVYVTEYSSHLDGDNARRVWMSKDDGVTWTLVHNPASVVYQHVHKIVGCVVSGIPTVFAAYGDYADTKAIYQITDDGYGEWSSSQVSGAIIQPTAGIWLPDQTEIIWGQDGTNLSGFWDHNLSDNSLYRSFPIDINKPERQQFYNGTYNVMGIIRVGGVLYAAIVNSNAAEQYNAGGIYATLDGSDWVRIIALNDNNHPGNLTGPDINGCIWYTTSTGSAYFDPPTIRPAKGAWLERASNNLADSFAGAAQDASLTVTSTSSEGVWAGMDSGSCMRIQNASGTPITATKYAQIGGTSGAGYYAITTGTPVANSNFVCSFRYKGTYGDGSGNNRGSGYEKRLRCDFLLRDGSGTTVTQTAHGFLYNNPSGWVEKTISVRNTADFEAAQFWNKLMLYFMGDADPEDAEFDVLIDGLVIENAVCPASYYPAATDRAQDVLSYSPTSFPDTFTDIETVAFNLDYFNCGWPTSGDGESYIYIKSYAEDADNFIALIYDVTDYKIKLIDEADGASNVIASTAAIYTIKHEPVTTALVSSGSSATAYIWQGGSLQTLTGTVTDHAISTVYWGSHPAGTQGGSTLFYDNNIYDSAMSLMDIQGTLYSTVRGIPHGRVRIFTPGSGTVTLGE